MNAANEVKVVLVCSDGDNTRILYHGIKSTVNISTIIIEQKEKKGKFIRRRIKRLGFFTVLGQLLFQGLLVPLMRRLSVATVAKILKRYDLDSSPMPETLVKRVLSVNSTDFINQLNSANPDLILVNGTRIISEKILNNINCLVINVHAGITPIYRGVHGAYWALANKDLENCGVTVHAIDKGIDTGSILAQDTIAPGPQDNFITYPYLQFQKAIVLLQKIVPELLKGKVEFLPPPKGNSRLWYHPTIWQYLYFRIFKKIK